MPTLSSEGAKGAQPRLLMAPCVVLSPIKPQVAAGMRTEPAVSVPKAA